MPKFKFELGQKVYFRCARNDVNYQPTQFIIVSRALIENNSGYTKEYDLGDDSIGWVDELELTIEKPVYDPVDTLKILSDLVKINIIPHNYSLIHPNIYNSI